MLMVEVLSSTTISIIGLGEHKIEGEKGNYAQVGVHCYSSSDLYNWNDEGIALKVSSEPNSDIVQCILERPKVIYNPNTKNLRYVVPFRT